MTHFADHDGRTLHYDHRPGTGPKAVVFANSLGTDFRIWDDVVADLPGEVPLLRLDKAGHGLSEGGAETIAALADDTAALMDRLGLSGAVICGVSVGGMIAQALAVARPDLVSGLVLCCTGPKIGDDATWNARIDAVRTGGIASIADQILERWFSAGFRAARPVNLAGYRMMLSRTDPEGYAAVCAAIRDADLTAQAARIGVPTLCLAGSDDLSTPPALVADLARAIPGAEYRLIEGCGHLPCIETPAEVATAIRRLLGPA